MGKLGMMGIYFPTEVGGAGGDVLSYVMAVEELSKVCGTTGVIVLCSHQPVRCSHLRERHPPSRRQSTCPSCAAASGWVLSA